MSSPQNHQTIILDLCDQPEIADPVFPELPKPRAVQGLSDAAGVVPPGNSFMQELQDCFDLLRVEFAECPIHLGRQRNVVWHAVSHAAS